LPGTGWWGRKPELVRKIDGEVTRNAGIVREAGMVVE
jgi:hypothetical protein